MTTLQYSTLLASVIEGTATAEQLPPCVNLLPEYTGWKAKCTDMLMGLSFDDFLHAIDAYREMADTTDRHPVTTLCTALYTPPQRPVAASLSPAGRDCFAVLGQRPVLGHTMAEPTPPPLLALHCANLFATSWQAITSHPVNINGEMVDIALIFRPTLKAGRHMPDDRLGWNSIRLEVAKSGVFGTIDHVDRAQLWDVLMWLYKCRWDYEHCKS